MTGQTTGHLKVDTPRAIVPSLSTCDGWAQYFAECGLRNVESCQGVICGKSSAKHSANYPLSLFRIPQLKNSTFTRIANYLGSHGTTNVQVKHSNVRRHSVPSFRILVVHLPKNRAVFLQFLLTSKSVPHSRCHIISLVNVNGFNLYNWCDSCRDDR